MKTEAEYLDTARRAKTSELIQAIASFTAMRIQIEQSGGVGSLEVADQLGGLFGDLFGDQFASKRVTRIDAYKELKLLAKAASEVLDQRLKPYACLCPDAPLA